MYEEVVEFINKPINVNEPSGDSLTPAKRFEKF